MLQHLYMYAFAHRSESRVPSPHATSSCWEALARAGVNCCKLFTNAIDTNDFPLPACLLLSYGTGVGVGSDAIAKCCS